MSTRGEHTCGLSANREIWCWGGNEYGQLGIGNYDNMNVPTAVTGGHKFASISAGNSHTCGITISGDAYCWGLNYDGQLGINNDGDVDSPQRVLTNLVGTYSP